MMDISPRELARLLVLMKHAAHKDIMRGFDAPRSNEDCGRIAMLPCPAPVVGPEVKPYGLHAAYYCGDE
jgi:hypothetical protein